MSKQLASTRFGALDWALAAALALTWGSSFLLIACRALPFFIDAFE
jgi:hypothetical protein